MVNGRAAISCFRAGASGYNTIHAFPDLFRLPPKIYSAIGAVPLATRPGWPGSSSISFLKAFNIFCVHHVLAFCPDGKRTEFHLSH